MTQGAPVDQDRAWWPSHPERRRLNGAIGSFEIKLAQVDPGAAWKEAAALYLDRARAHLRSRNYHEGWISLQAAERLVLANSDDETIELAAIELRHEAAKVAGWRADAIEDLICNQQGELRENIAAQRWRVIRAAALRDDQFQTNYFKIQLRRNHLFRLFLLLLASIVITLLLSSCEILPAPFNNIGTMTGVVLFGVLGASLSVARGLLVADISARIPAQQIGAFVIWMRPAIGAAAALISFVLLNAKVFKLFDWDPQQPTIIFTVAIVAGYSERFIVGAIEKIADGEDSRDDKKDDKKKKKDRQKAEGKAPAAEPVNPEPKSPEPPIRQDDRK